MAVNFGGKKVTGFPGLYVRSKDMISDAVIAFDVVNTTPTTATGKYFLYVESDGSLRFNNGSAITTIGAAGSVSSGTWDSIYSGDKTLTIGSGTLTFAGNAADGVNVFTVTNIAGSTGAAIQITNSTTSNPDIKGTSDTWKVLGTGAATFLSVTLSGLAGSTVQTITAGDVVYSDGSLAITDADNAATFSVTNDTATTASVFVWAGSGAFTGNTTSSFFTLTPSGLTTGTAFYLPVAALTTGKAVHVVANAVTSGLVFNLTSSSASMTSGGRLLNVASTAATNTSAVLNEFATAGNDETVLLRLTASDILALGKVLHISASSMTTGNAIDAGALDALTTGIGALIASTSTTLTTGSLLRLSTGTTGAVATSGIFSLTATAAYTSTSNCGLMQVVADSVTAGATVVNISATAATTSVALRVVSSGTGLTTGSLAIFTTGTTGILATNGAVSIRGTGAFTSTSMVDGGLLDVRAASTTGGLIVNVVGAALTTGVAVSISNGTAATTSGSLLRVAAGGTGAVATNGIVSFTHTGVYTSTSAVDGGFVEVKASGTTAGTIVNVVGAALTTGIGLQLSNGTSGMTTGSLIRVTASGTGTVATNGIVSITHAGIFVSTANAGVLDVRASAMVGTASNGTLVNFMTTAAAQVDTTVLNVENSGFTTGYTGVMLRVKSPTTTGACKVVGIIADGMTTAGVALHVSTAALAAGGKAISVDLGSAVAGNALNLVTTGAYSGTGMALITVGAMATGVGLSIISTTGLTSGSLIRATTATAGAIATNGAISFSATANFTTAAGAAFMMVAANTTTSGTVLSVAATSATGATILSIEATDATLTSGSYIRCGGAGAVFSVGKAGATVIAGSASGTAALTITAGDLAVSSGTFSVSGTATLTSGIAAKVIFAGTETIAAGGTSTALSLTKTVHYIDADAGGDIFTLADGTAGQIMTILLTSSTGTATITPTNLAGGTSVTLNADGDTVVLQFMDTEWFILGGNSYAVV